LARYLGTISETLSRNLKKLKDDKTIDVRGDEIAILDMDKLAEIAESEHS
jgi:CRP-like cAMP-binding protein